jgi:hypothetical protein
MNVPYLVRTQGTQFYPVILAQLHAAGLTAFRDGAGVACEFTPDGYAGTQVVSIVPGDVFEAPDFASQQGDWSRFPARIRAAATALRDFGYEGRARIAHQQGALTVAVAGE